MTYSKLYSLLFVHLSLSFFWSCPAFGQIPLSVRDCSAYPYSAPFSSAQANYVPRYHTIGQEFLDRERGIGPVTPSEYAILDALLDEAKQRLKPIPTDLQTKDYETFAVNSLKTMDCILVRHGFVYPGIGLVQLLSDGLDTTRFTGIYYQQLKGNSHNAGRLSFIEKRNPGPFYVVDCDIASFLYLAMGQVMGYPLAMVDLPGHNFVRWKKPDGTYIDFETMDGKKTDDTYYISGRGIPQSFLGTPGVLTTMSPGELIAYHYFTIGIAVSWKHDYLETIAQYMKSIATDATLNDAANNLSWLYAVVPTIGLRDPQKAVAYGKQATTIFANGDTLDTLACAYAMSNDFSKAIETEMKAVKVGWAPQGSNLIGDLQLLQAHQHCQDLAFGRDKDSFRQAATIPLPSQPKAK